MTLPDGNTPTPPNVSETSPDQETPSKPPAGSDITETLKTFQKSILEDVKNITNEITSKGFSAAQSHTDKTVRKAQDSWKEELDKTVQDLRAKGANITDAQVRDMQLDRLISGQEQASGVQPSPGTETPPNVSQPTQAELEFRKYVTQQGIELLKELEVEFEKDDPELEIIQQAAQANKAPAYFDAIREAARKKKERLASDAEGRLHSKTMGGGPTSPLDGLHKNPDALWDKVKEKHNL